MHVRTGPSGRESSGDVEIFRRPATSGQLYLLPPLLSETGAPSLGAMTDLQCAATLLLVPSYFSIAISLESRLARWLKRVVGTEDAYSAHPVAAE